MAFSRTASFVINLSAVQNFVEEHAVRLAGREAKGSASGINRTLQEGQEGSA